MDKEIKIKLHASTVEVLNEWIRIENLNRAAFDLPKISRQELLRELIRNAANGLDRPGSWERSHVEGLCFHAFNPEVER